MKKTKPIVMQTGKFIRMMTRAGWEYVERTNCTGVVIILAMTAAKRIIFIEQYRIPVNRKVIEFPAGLVNDIKPKSRESFRTAAKRELLEETGYQSEKIELIVEGPMSSGLSADRVIVCRASGLVKVSAGGGDDTESISVHEVPLNRAEQWLEAMRKNGRLVDPKVYMGLYFLGKK